MFGTRLTEHYRNADCGSSASRKRLWADVVARRRCEWVGIDLVFAAGLLLLFTQVLQHISNTRAPLPLPRSVGSFPCPDIVSVPARARIGFVPAGFASEYIQELSEAGYLVYWRRYMAYRVSWSSAGTSVTPMISSRIDPVHLVVVVSSSVTSTSTPINVESTGWNVSSAWL